MTEMLRDILIRLESMNERLSEGFTEMEDRLDNEIGDTSDCSSLLSRFDG